MTERTPVVLITGASSGIGAELARQWARASAAKDLPARLALAARRTDRLETLARELERTYGANVLAHATDMAQPSQIAALVEKVKMHFGRLDVLVNNAGVLKMEPFLHMSSGDMQYMMNVNFWGPLHAVRAAAPIMAETGGGHILQVTSGAGRRGLPFMAVYSATKFALAGLTESLRLELKAQGIDFTTVYPGGVDTEMPASVDVARLPKNYPRHGDLRISAERAARAIRKAIECRPLEVYVPWWVRYTSWLAVVAPGLTDRLIRMGYKDALWNDPDTPPVERT
jgi:short-subunit dehydrogenase